MVAKFAFKVSAFSEIAFTVSDGADRYTVTLGCAVSDYHLSIANGDDARRAMLGRVGGLYRSPAGPPISAATVAAFNSWRAAEHAALIAHRDATAPRYDCIPADDSIWQPPAQARGIHWADGQWRPIEPAAELCAA